MKNLLLVISLSISHLVFGQIKEYSGVVLEGNLPILGATVTVKGTEIFSKTDFDGNFTIHVPNNNEILIFSFSGYETIEYQLRNDNFIKIQMNAPRERGIWMSIGSFSDLIFAPYGISISNGQEEQNLLHFEDFQERISLNLAIASDFSDNLMYKAKFTYHLPLVNWSLSNTSIEYVNKDYSEFKFEDLNLSTNVTRIGFINALLTAKLGVQIFDDDEGFGGAIGVEKKYYNLRFQYGAQIGYWNDDFTYNFHLRKFLIKNRLSVIANYDRIKNTHFFEVGLHFLFKTDQPKY